MNLTGVSVSSLRRYRSARRLCALAEGFVTGTADYFGEQVLIQQPRCMLHGEERCALVCTFSAAA